MASFYHKLPLPEQPKTRLTSARHFCTEKAHFRQGARFFANILIFAQLTTGVRWAERHYKYLIFYN